jgi:hypothetical protein
MKNMILPLIQKQLLKLINDKIIITMFEFTVNPKQFIDIF